MLCQLSYTRIAAISTARFRPSGFPQWPYGGVKRRNLRFIGSVRPVAWAIESHRQLCMRATRVGAWFRESKAAGDQRGSGPAVRIVSFARTNGRRCQRPRQRIGRFACLAEACGGGRDHLEASEVGGGKVRDDARLRPISLSRVLAFLPQIG